MTMMYRQGDVLLIERRMPTQVSKVPAEAGRVILAYGEVTGHAHLIESPGATLYTTVDKVRRFLEVARDVVLRHEEHAPVGLPVGVYEVVIQREYTPEAIRNVAD